MGTCVELGTIFQSIDCAKIEVISGVGRLTPHPSLTSNKVRSICEYLCNYWEGSF